MPEPGESVCWRGAPVPAPGLATGVLETRPDLQGAGPGATLGPVRISTMAIKTQMQQAQWWLRGHGHAGHVHHVTPSGAVALRGVIGRVLATLRFEP